jgi:hypothetical protein
VQAENRTKEFILFYVEAPPMFAQWAKVEQRNESWQDLLVK